MNHIRLYLLFAVAIQSFSYADVTKLSAEDRKTLQDASRFHELHSTSDLPAAILAICDGGGDGGSQSQARSGMRLMSSRIQLSQASASFGELSAANIMLSITSAAESLTPITFWLRNSQRITRNRKQSGAPLEVRSRITRHFSMHCEAGSWMTV